MVWSNLPHFLHREFLPMLESELEVFYGYSIKRLEWIKFLCDTSLHTMWLRTVCKILPKWYKLTTGPEFFMFCFGSMYRVYQFLLCNFVCASFWIGISTLNCVKHSRCWSSHLLEGLFFLCEPMKILFCKVSL